jgi:hypothetical protein
MAEPEPAFAPNRLERWTAVAQAPLCSTTAWSDFVVRPQRPAEANHSFSYWLAAVFSLSFPVFAIVQPWKSIRSQMIEGVL